MSPLGIEKPATTGWQAYWLQRGPRGAGSETAGESGGRPGGPQDSGLPEGGGGGGGGGRRSGGRRSHGGHLLLFLNVGR